MTDKNDKSQTPAPKVSHAKDASEEKSSNLLKQMHEAEKGAANNPDATKTPEKIKNGDLSEKKTEY
jgi:hypothetical protein